MANWRINSLNRNDPQHVFDDIEQQFKLDDQSLVELTKAFLTEVKLGLGEYGRPMAIIPTFVTGVPDGSETGTFLALDLGGTNLRVCQVDLHGDKTFSLRQQKYKVSDELKTGEATALFDYLADSVDAFLTSDPPIADEPRKPKHPHGPANPFDVLTPILQPRTPSSKPHTPAHSRPQTPFLSSEQQTPGDPVHLGLTFSFPVEQTALDSGMLLTWTKGFSARHAIGQDIVKLLQDAFHRKHMHVKCVALVNDTVGALLSRAYTGGGCLLGAIFGTGTNGAYVEQVENISKLQETHPKVFESLKGGHMVVNCEWGAFNNTRSHLPSTPYDNALDRLSINPAKQAFEKFISGMYLGEITRRLILSLIDASPPGLHPQSHSASGEGSGGKKGGRGLVFGGRGSEVLNKMWGVDTQYMSEVEDAWGKGSEIEGQEGVQEDTKDGEDTQVKLASGDELPSYEGFDPSKLSKKTKERLERVREVVVKRFGFEEGDVGLWDAAVVRWACRLVAGRAAHLSGVAVAAVLVQTGRALLPEDRVEGSKKEPKIKGEKAIVVGVDGSLVEHYPNFERTLRESLRFLVGEEVEKRVDIGMAKDGSGVGAALCALQALKQQTFTVQS